jgi:hypothetical protein
MNGGYTLKGRFDHYRSIGGNTANGRIYPPPSKYLRSRVRMIKIKKILKNNNIL